MRRHNGVPSIQIAVGRRGSEDTRGVALVVDKGGGHEALVVVALGQLGHGGALFVVVSIEADGRGENGGEVWNGKLKVGWKRW